MYWKLTVEIGSLTHEYKEDLNILQTFATSLEELWNLGNMFLSRGRYPSFFIEIYFKQYLITFKYER
jgi:hypothetical protein